MPVGNKKKPLVHIAEYQIFAFSATFSPADKNEYPTTALSVWNYGSFDTRPTAKHAKRYFW